LGQQLALINRMAVEGGKQIQGFPYLNARRQSGRLELDAYPFPQGVAIPLWRQTQHPNSAAIRPAQPLNAFNGSCFAGAVWPDHAEDFTPVNVEGDAVYGAYPSVLFDQITYFDDAIV
jgi:hypothetical protein